MNKRDANISANMLRRAGWPNVEIVKFAPGWRVYADSKAFDDRSAVEGTLQDREFWKAHKDLI